MKRCSIKKLVIMCLTITMIAACLAGCGASQGSAQTAKTDALDKILADGKIRVGLNPPNEPTAFQDADGNWLGYDVDWGNELGKQLGVEVEFVDVSADRIAGLTSDRVDVVIATMTATLERAKSVDFTIPYLRSGLKMAVRAGLEDQLKTIEDLNDPKWRVCVSAGATTEALVQERAPKATLVYLTSMQDYILAMQEDKADAFLEDSITVDYACQSSPSIVPQPTLYTSDPLCIAYQKGNPEFGRYLDMFVSNMFSSGWQGERYAYWYGKEYTAPVFSPW